ncbi:MAG: CHAT domain-containing protein, partial [Myxococcales bacterium]|nr:CHAT domain-containing protein [Myxococcales bacterium]
MALESSFVRLGASWTVAQALEVMGAVNSRYIIVHRLDRKTGAEYFYAYPRAEIMSRLTGRDGTIFDLLDLHEYTATPTATGMPARLTQEVVVLDGGRILGVGKPDVLIRGDILESAGDDDTQSRQLSASAPSEIAVGAEVSLLAKISAALEVAAGPSFTTKENDKIDLVLEASGAVEVVGATDASVTITGTAALVQRFKIRGREIGEGKVDVYAFKGGSSVATVTVTTRVVNAVASATTVARVADIRAVERPADLAMWITEDKHARSYQIRLTSADSNLNLNLAPFGPIVLTGNVEAFFASFYGDVEQVLTSAQGPKDKIAALAVKGDYLFQTVMPQPLRDRLWDLRDRISSVQIQSEEPWVPWELCKLSGPSNGRIVEGGFLTEAFRVTRWFPGLPQRSSLSLGSIALVVPTGSGLPAAPAERDFVRGLAGSGRKVTDVAPRAGDLRAALAAGIHDGLHFTGHGAANDANPDRSTISLESGNKLSPEDLSGPVANLGLTHPLVIFNACEVGRSGTGLMGLAGWPQAFIKAGAGAFIAPFWKVADGTASLFAQTFYTEVLQRGASVADGVHAARAAVRTASDPTWLAYVAYAHPFAKVAALAAPG